MDTFFARQPVFDHRRRVFGYELLFRSGPEDYFSARPGVETGAEAGTGAPGVHDLTDGKAAFVAFDRRSLLGSFASLLSPEEVVVELLPSVVADPEVLEACERLKRQGFRIALDKFVETEATAPLLSYVDFVKVDVASTPEPECRRVGKELGEAGISMLAERVETWETFGRVANCGYRYFAGSFFSRPVMVSAKAIPGFRLNYLRLVEELAHPTSVDRLERVIKQEASIAYRLLRRVNSLAFGFQTEVRSLRHALVLLGEHEIRTSAMAWLLAEIGQESPSEVVVASTLRARMCELLMLAEPATASSASDLFLVGLFSMLDALMERPMEQVIQNLPLSHEAHEALLGRPSRARAVLECVMAYERGGWSLGASLARAANIDEASLASAYARALAWTNAVFRQPAAAQ